MSETRTLTIISVEPFTYGDENRTGWTWLDDQGHEYKSFSRHGSSEPPKVVAAWRGLADNSEREYLVETSPDKDPKMVGIVGVYEPKPFEGGGNGGGQSFASGGGGRGRSPEETASIQRQTCLKAGAEIVARLIERLPENELNPGDLALFTIEVANRFVAWVTENSGATVSAPDAGEAAGPAPAPQASPAPRPSYPGSNTTSTVSSGATVNDGHAHDYGPVNEKGWAICMVCGKAERAA